MLPLLLGLGGSALGASGAIAGLGALGAGAIGSGLGSYLQTGDLGKGVQTGLLSYFGGKALGSMFGGADAAAGGADLMQAPESITSASQAADLAALNPNIPVTGPLGTGGAMVDSTAGLLSGQGAPSLTSSLPAASSGFAADPTAALTSQATGSTLGQAMSASAPYTLSGAAVGALPDLLAPPELQMAPKKEYNTKEAEAADRERFTPGADFRPGIDPEFGYFGPIKYADGGLTSLAYQEGGDMDRSQRIQDLLERGAQKEMRANDKEIISKAVKAIQGMSEAPEQDLGQFLSRYGEEALRDLVERVQSGAFEFEAMKSEGQINGVGDGMDDMIPATLEGEQDVVLSDGEFIVPADVVSGLGNGSTNAGSEALYEMMDRVREMRTGKKEQPDQVPQDMMLPA